MLRTNVLILGKSGSGKSALLNYLWGGGMADTGTGRAVTPRSRDGECAIYSHDPITVGDLEVSIHDTWGMEADKAEEWAALLKREADRREASDDIGDWYHTVIYCVSAKGARLETFEMKSIIPALIAQGQCVMFALTKCDIASAEEIAAMRALLDAEFKGHGGIVELNSVSQVVRKQMEPTIPFGRELMMEGVLANFRANLMNKLRSQFVRKCSQYGEHWKARTMVNFDDRIGPFTSVATGLRDVNGLANRRLLATTELLRKWLAQRTGEAEDMLESFSTGFLGAKEEKGGWLDVAQPVMESKELEWDWTEKAANITMYLLPGINFAYLFFGKDMHRDDLAKKLDAIVARMVERAGSGPIFSAHRVERIASLNPSPQFQT